MQDTSRFILSEAYLIWNSLLQEYHTKHKDSNNGLSREIINTRIIYKATKYTNQIVTDLIWMSYIWTNNARPGFVILYFELTELLEIPAIRSKINPRDVNGIGMSLRTCARMWSRDSTFERFFKLLPGEEI